LDSGYFVEKLPALPANSTPGFQSTTVGPCAIILAVIWVDVNLLQKSKIDKERNCDKENRAGIL